MKIALRRIRLPFTEPEEYAKDKAKKKLNSLGISYSDCEIYKRSVDARRKGEIFFEYTVCFECETLPSEKALEKADGIIINETVPDAVYGKEPCDDGIVIVGFGPCGMFCALTLAEKGYKPTVIERGSSVYERAAAVELFYKSGKLDKNNNIQFGAGGAGTFSDGKLVTRVNDPMCRYILNTFHSLGAPDDIMTNAKPHIGTDKLMKIVENAEKRICELGGRVLYNTVLTSVCSSGGRVRAAVTNNGEIPCSALVLAVGHSARDTYSALEETGVILSAKPFSVGVRIEHRQSDIDYALYGKFAGDPRLPAGEYNLSKRSGDRGVYTFCMCPGGKVVAAASEEGGVVTNGMSEYARDGVNANAALAVSVLPSDFGGDCHAGIEFVRNIEKKAYIAGGGNFRAPAQTVGDFLSGQRGGKPSLVEPTYMNGNVNICDLGDVLPDFVISYLKMGIISFEKRLRGFSAPFALLTGAETRTSSPVRILRDETGLASGFENLYPCGEGAGYAGGITSAALDGIKCALKLIERYRI